MLLLLQNQGVYVLPKPFWLLKTYTRNLPHARKKPTFSNRKPRCLWAHPKRRNSKILHTPSTVMLQKKFWPLQKRNMTHIVKNRLSGKYGPIYKNHEEHEEKKEFFSFVLFVSFVVL